MKRYWLAAVLAVVSTSAFAVFQTRGELSVSDSGALTYSVPIAVPPGAGGMEPKIALNYNSQGGNGLMGMGWSVSGLTAISRCPQTIAQDGVPAAGEVNYTVNDRFCMDGQRLVSVSGSYGGVGAEYRTELESYAKVVSYSGTAGNPQYFKVWTKAGQIIEYGNTADSRAEASTGGPARIWMVNRISDTKGNSIEFVYEEDTANGEHRPKEIKYTLNSAAGLTTALNSVVFQYEARPDTILGFHAGSPVKTTQRIAKLQVNARGKTVREYRFTYAVGNGAQPDGNLIGTQRSHLISLQECAVDPVTSCLNPTRFDWTTAYPGYEVDQWSTVNNKFHTGDTGKNATGDFNGDGKTDVVSYIGDNNSEVRIHLSNGAGFVGAVWTGQFKTSAASSKNWIGDFNGDGKSDIASWSGTGDVNMNLSTGSGFITQTWVGSFNDNGTSSKNWLGDFNGDGLTDIGNKQGTGSLIVNLSTGSGFTTQTWPTLMDEEHNWRADFNGDGKTDIASWCCAGNALRMNLSTGTGFTQVQWEGLELHSNSGSTGRNYRGDYNGDGKTDIASWKQGGDLLVMHMSTGTGFVKEYWTSNLHDSTSNWIGDYNGDGRSDIASWPSDANAGHNLRVHLSEGTQFRRESWATDLYPDKDDMYHWFGDFDGDGRTDIASRFREEITSTDPETGEIITSHGSIDEYKVNLHRAYNISTLGAVYPDIITKVTEGMGATQTIEYLPLTDTNVYSKGFATGPRQGDGAAVSVAYPYVDVEIPLYAVSRVRASNGVGGELSSRYTYNGLRSHSQGRGLLGFAKRSVIQEQRNITTNTEYAQVFPHAGMPLLATKELPGRPLSQSAMLYGCLDPATGAACTFAVGNRYFPYANSSTEQSWELTGGALPITTTSNTYDLWGNVTQVQVSTTNAGGAKAYSKTTSNIYNAPDTANWILGRLQKATVTVSAPDATAQ